VKDQFGTPQQQEQSRTPLACVDDYNDEMLLVQAVGAFYILDLFDVFVLLNLVNFVQMVVQR